MNKKLLGTICCIVIGAALSQQTAFSASAFAEHYDAAQNFLMQNQYSSAIVEFRKSLKINYMDNSARIGLINSYLARGTYYANTEKNYEKAANDFRSAIFYLKMYPSNEQDIQNSIGMASSAAANLNQCLKVLSFDTTPSARYEKAEELRAISNFSAAAYEFSKAAESDKYKSIANAQIADMLKQLGNPKRSADYYKIAMDSNPNDGNLRMRYARTLDSIGDYDSAAEQYNQALDNSKGDTEILYSLERIYRKKLAQNPSNAEMNTNLGAIKQAQGDYESALEYYARAEQLDPQNTTTRINVGTLYQQRKDYNRALQAYNSVLTLQPDNTQAMYYKAQALSEMGDKQAAMNLYKSILTLDPNNSGARTAIGGLMKEQMSPVEYINYLSQNGTAGELYEYGYKLHKENKITEAISAYRAVLMKDQSNVDAYINLAICYAAKDDYGSAITTLNTAKDKFPSNNLVLKTLKEVQSDYSSTRLSSASSNYENKNYKQALQEFLSINPATASSLLGAAATYQALDDYDNAIAYYKKAEALDPNNAEIPYCIGYLYSEQKNWTLSEQYLNKAIKLNPNSEAKNLISYVEQNLSLDVLNSGIDLYQKKNYTEAMLKFDDVLKKDANNAYAYYYKGLIHDEQQQPKLAINDYLNVLKNSKDFPIVNYMTAVDYDTLENYKEAYKYYKQFTASYTTDDEYLKYAQNRMKELEPHAG